MQTQEIKKLPTHVINQIKAGEVVEKPASVIKELVENSIDAGATQIVVELLDGGKRLIQVSDNGSGISKNKLSLALERHTTSKISDTKDLDHLNSFGFRGEALASIVSVSHFSIKSKTQTEQTGFEISCQSGEKINEQITVMENGTIIQVKDLFNNVPARLKFLKTTSTEFSHIQEFLTATSFYYFNISFKLIHNGRVVFDHKKKSSFTERATEILGLQTKSYAPIFFSKGHFKISGLGLLPEYVEKVSPVFFSFVNGRFVKDKLIRSSIYDGYQGLLLKGQTPSGIFFVNVDPSWLDINVHPSKIEVRFLDPYVTGDLISQGVQDSLKSALNQKIQTPKHMLVQKSDLYEKTKYDPIKTSHNGTYVSLQNISKKAQIYPVLATTQARKEEPQFKRFEHLAELKNQEKVDTFKEKSLPIEEESTLFETVTNHSSLTSAQFLGQFLNCYLIFENNREMIIVDQHAFHERILFEEISLAHKKQKLEKQILIHPIIVSHAEFQTDILADQLDTLISLGFECTLKNNDLQIETFPGFIEKKYIEKTLHEVLSCLVAHKNVKFDSLYHTVFASMACHSAVRSGDPMNEELVRRLLVRSEQVDFFAHCPHGRPVIRKFSERDVSLWFERI